jgi:hypothetical protein
MENQVTIAIKGRSSSIERDEMTTIQVTLPDQLAQEAERAGLLSPGFLEKWLRDQLKARRSAEFLSALDQLDAAGSQEFMSPEEVAEEIAAMRAAGR